MSRFDSVSHNIRYISHSNKPLQYYHHDRSSILYFLCKEYAAHVGRDERGQGYGLWLWWCAVICCISSVFWRQDVNFPAYVVTNIRYSTHKRLRCYYNMSAYVGTDQPQSSPLLGFCRVTLFHDVICMPIFAAWATSVPKERIQCCDATRHAAVSWCGRLSWAHVPPLGEVQACDCTFVQCTSAWLIVCRTWVWNIMIQKAMGMGIWCNPS